MRNFFIFGVLFCVLVSCSNQVKEYVVSGQATDFNGAPIDSVTIKLMNKQFETIYETLSDQEGKYSMKVKEGDYYCLYAIKSPDYRVSRLEYWNWNVPVHQDMTINPQYDRMEIYGIHVFETKVSPFETYMIYFRPMSLKKSLQIVAAQQIGNKAFKNAERTEDLLGKSDKVLNISPDSISAEELLVEINGKKAEIVGINKISEYARGFIMYGYCVQVLKPKNDEMPVANYNLVSVTLKSAETGETGKGEIFVER